LSSRPRRRRCQHRPGRTGAPFPEPDEELYGVATNGKLYVIGGWADGKAGGVTYEYDPATDKWTKKQSMPRPAHHAALAAANGKIYVMGGFVAPSDTALPLGAAWQPIDNAWQYDPVTDSWKSLAPLPTKRGSAVAVEVGGKIYTIGGATTMEGRVLDDSIGRLGDSKDPFFTAFGPARGSQRQRSVRPRHEQVGDPPTDVGAAQSRVCRCGERQDLRHRRSHRPGLHPDRHEHRCGGGVQPPL
jgi:hypothetical protein